MMSLKEVFRPTLCLRNARSLHQMDLVPELELASALLEAGAVGQSAGFERSK